MSVCSDKDKDKEPKIVYRLEKVGDRALIFQVLHMDERFRRLGNGTASIIVSHKPTGEGIPSVVSSGTPQLGMVGGYAPRFARCANVYLQGNNKNYDSIPTIVSFTTEKERDRALMAINDALEDWCDNWVGWAPSKKKVWNGDLPDGCVALSSEG